MRERGYRVKLLASRRTVVAALGAVGIVLTLAAPRDVGAGSLSQPVGAATQASDSRQPAPCGQSQTQITEGKPAQAWFQDPIGRMAYVFRMARYLGGEPQRNIAIAFVDITGLDNLDTRGYQVMNVSALKSSNRPLYDTLRLADRPNVQRIAIVPDSNVPQAPGTNGSQHSEQMVIFKDLTYLSPSDGGASITPDRVFAFYSDRSPCGPKKNDCAGLMCSTTDVFYATVDDPPAPPRTSRKTRSSASAQPTAHGTVPPDDTSAVQDMERFISAAQAQASGSAAVEKEIEAEKQRNEQRAAAEQSRKKTIAESGKTFDYAIERRDLFRASAAKSSNADASANSPGSTAAADSGFAQVLAQPLVAAPAASTSHACSWATWPIPATAAAFNTRSRRPPRRAEAGHRPALWIRRRSRRTPSSFGSNWIPRRSGSTSTPPSRTASSTHRWGRPTSGGSCCRPICD
jgi:hypothetical protein